MAGSNIVATKRPPSGDRGWVFNHLLLFAVFAVYSICAFKPEVGVCFAVRVVYVAGNGNCGGFV